jgi:hypothetical protein
METTADILRRVGYFCLGAALIFLVTGITDVWRKKGLEAAFALLYPDPVNLIVLVLPFVPGVLLWWLATVLKDKGDARRVVFGEKIQY